MPSEKSVSMGFRVTPEFKRLLDIAARHDHRTMTNLLEKLLTDYCRSRGLLPVEALTETSALHTSSATLRSSAQRSGNEEKT